jgi:hypothetical protein
MERISPIIADNATGRIWLIDALRRAGMDEEVPGGNELHFPVLKELQSVKAYRDLDPLDVNRADPVTIAKYELKQLAVPVQISGRDMLINSGDDVRMTNLLSLFVDSAILAVRSGLSDATTGIYSSNTESDAGVTGLQNLLTHTSNSTPTSGTAGGLNRATYSFWRNQVANVSSDFSANGFTQMNTLYVNCSRGDERPDVIVLTRSAYINYIINLTGTISYNQPLTSSRREIDAAPSDVYFAGTNALLGFEDGVPANQGFFLNSKYTHFITHPQRNIEVGSFVDMRPTQDAIATQVLWAGNFCMSNMARQGLLLNADTN